MPSDIEILRARFKDLDESNDASYKQLVDEYEIPMDTTGARMELLIEHLKDVMGEEAWLKFEIAFHLKVKEALDSTWKQIRDSGIQPKKKPLPHDRGRPQIITPDKKLIIPPSARRKNG